MAILYNLTGAVSLLRAVVADVLTQEGEAPLQIPLTTTDEQVTLDPADLPLTVIEFGKGSSEQQGLGEYLSAPMMIHHVRRTEPGTGSGAITAGKRLQAIAKRLQNDYRMQSVTVDGAPAIESVSIDDLTFGSSSRAMHILTLGDQTISMAAATLSVTLHWFEFWD